jgi:hypothetical protein
MTPLFYEDSLGAKIAEHLASSRIEARQVGAARRAAALSSCADHAGDAELLDDVEALAAAEILAAEHDPLAPTGEPGDEWVTIFGPAKISGFFDAPWPAGFIFVAPLAAAGIPNRWEPYPPELMPGFRAGTNAVDRPFSLTVPAQFAHEASSAMATLGVEATGRWSQFGVPLRADRTAEAIADRRFERGVVAAAPLALNAAILVMSAIYALADLILHGANQ